jgi:Ricin-type beta-trefoil lectin domain-like
MGLGEKRTSDAHGQQWAFTEVGAGFYMITSRVDGRAIDIPWGRDTEGLLLQFYGPHRGNNQLWRLQRP